MRSIWQRTLRSETALGLLLLVITFAGVFGMVEWLMAAGHACAPGDTAPACDDSMLNPAVALSVFGPLLFLLVAIVGMKLSSRERLRRWAAAGLIGAALCLAVGAGVAAVP